MKNIYKTCFTFTLISSLVACSQNTTNTLKSHTNEENGIFLMVASYNVEKRLHLPILNGEQGSAYGKCMEGKAKRINCKELFKAIVNFAKEGHFKGYETLTTDDIANKKSFDNVETDYANALMNIFPRDYK